MSCREISGSLSVSVEVGKLIRNIIGQAISRNETDVNSLYEFIEGIGNRIGQAQPIGKDFDFTCIIFESPGYWYTSTLELAGQNMVKRILHLIKEEQLDMEESEAFEEEMSADSDEPEVNKIRALIRQGIEEIIDEIENSSTNIANQALEHIHSK